MVLFSLLQEEKRFFKYLLDKEAKKQRPHVSKTIKRIFPNFFLELEESDNKKRIIRSFLDAMISKHEEKINGIQKRLEIKLNKDFSKIILGLENSMCYSFNKLLKYNIELTLLPVSLYGDDNVVLSILDELGGFPSAPYVEIIIHELSHIVFEKKMLEIYKKEKKLNTIVHHYLKELIAPVVLRDKVFDHIKESRQLDYANPEQQELFLDVDGSVLNFVDYLQSKLDSFLDFDQFLLDAYCLCKNISSEIENKHKIFHENHVGQNMRDQKFVNFLEEVGYRDPIKI